MYILRLMQKWIAYPPTGRLFHSAIVTPLGRITWAGRHLNIRPHNKMPMRYWDTYSMVYIIEGNGRYYNQDGLNMPIKAGNLLIMFPRHGYRYQINQNSPWSEFFIQFKGPIFSLWTREGLLNPNQPIYHLEPIKYWWQRMENIICPLNLPEPSQSLKRLCMLQEFLVDALLVSRISKSTPEQVSWIAKAKMIIESSIPDPPKWEELSKELGISYARFRKQFTVLTGISPGRYRTAKIIEKSEDLLHDKRYSIKQIASMLGFCDEFHFSRRFKSITGLTPAQFRRRFL